MTTFAARLRPQWLVVTAFLILAGLYNLATPIFEAPDESFHFFVIQHIREGRGLPVQGAPGEALYEQEGSQPPLYYLAGALLTAWIDTTDARAHLRENPQANLGDPADPGNKNRYVHTPGEAFPYRDTPLAVRVLRVFSTVLGAIVVACTGAIARRVRPDAPGLAVFASAIVAFTPQFVFISAAVNNDNAINALAAIALVLLARAWQGDRSARNGLALALVAGLATLAKLGGVILLAFVCAVLVYLGWTRREWQWGKRSLAIVLLSAALIGGWWYARNLQLYGDLTGLSAMLAIVGRRALSVPELVAELPGLWLSAWGVFGWFNALLPDPVYLAYTLLSIAGALGGLIALSRARFSRRSIEPIAGLLLWSVLVTVGVLRWTSTTLGSQGRLLFPAAPALAILLALGLSQWFGRYRRVARRAMVLAMLVAAVWAPINAIAPGYALPRKIALDDVPADIGRLNLDFNGEIRLIGGSVTPADAAPGDMVTVTLYWQALRKPGREYMVAIKLLGRGLDLIGHEDAYHGAGTYPSDMWQAGEVLADPYRIRISEAAMTPTRVRVEVGLRDRTTRQPVVVTGKSGERYDGSVYVDEMRLGAHEPIADPQIALDYRIGEAIVLAGYERPQIAPDGQSIIFRLHWRAVSTPAGDYTVFAHLVDSQGRLIGQRDNPPFDGDYPTSWWRPGETFVEERRIRPLHSPSEDAARILVGLYTPLDVTRLPVRDANGSPVPNDSISLEIQPSQAWP